MHNKPTVIQDVMGKHLLLGCEVRTTLSAASYELAWWRLLRGSTTDTAHTTTAAILLPTHAHVPKPPEPRRSCSGTDAYTFPVTIPPPWYAARHPWVKTV